MWLLLLLASPLTQASDTAAWTKELGAVAIQDGGRIMPLDAYARRLAVQLTGREHWSKSNGPKDFAGRDHMELLCDLLFKGQQSMMQAEILTIEHRPFKTLVGLDPQRRFFTAAEVAMNKKLNELLMEQEKARMADPKAKASDNQRRAGDIFSAANRAAGLASGEQLPLVPAGDHKPFLKVGLNEGDPGTEAVRAAFNAMGKAYTSSGDMLTAVRNFKAAIAAAGTLDPNAARAIGYELLHDRHNPWQKTAIFYGLAIVLFGFSRLALRKPLVILAVVAAVIGVGEQMLGVGLRVAILDRAPVTNTYEALLWMGLVAMAIGLVAQIVNRSGYYLFGALGAAFLSVLFANLVPLEDRTNSLPAVLRSNYWLIVHVLTVTASYGVFAVASVLSHVYLTRQILFPGRRDEELAARRSTPLVVQTYRCIQIGLLLLTAGTILGGVWAADSWGRFWGWDPKETWALISIVVYFAVLHARYVRWIQDFGLACCSVLGFVVIVWTFYGVNYVMATGLHSYGFGSGGEAYVGAWALAELAFLVACRWRYGAIKRQEPAAVVAHQHNAPAKPA